MIIASTYVAMVFMRGFPMIKIATHPSSRHPTNIRNKSASSPIWLKGGIVANLRNSLI